MEFALADEIQGLKDLLGNLTQLGGQAVENLFGTELRMEGELIMADSKTNYVPVDFGTLRSTGLVTGPKREGGGLVVMLSYGGPTAPYALVVHENPRAGKTGGVSPQGKRYPHFAKHGQWKYLEEPVAKAQGGLAGRIAARLRGHLEASVQV